MAGIAYVSKGPAKTNLFLSVGRKVPERGLHLIDSAFLMLKIHDEGTFERKGKGITIECDDTSVPTDESNTLHKAAKAFARFLEVDLNREGNGVHITIKKGIPVAGGLGGSSALVGPFLFYFMQSHGFGKEDITEMMDTLLARAVKIGSDVPVSLYAAVNGDGSGTYYVSDVGQKVFLMQSMPKKPVVLVLPNRYYTGSKTAYMYGKIDTQEYHSLTSDEVKGAVDAIGMHCWDGLRRMRGLMINSFEDVAFKEWANLQAVKRLMLDNGAIHALLSGSGGAVLAIMETEREADRLLHKLTREAQRLEIKKIILTETN